MRVKLHDPRVSKEFSKMIPQTWCMNNKNVNLHVFKTQKGDLQNSTKLMKGMLQAEKKIFASRMSNIQIVSRIYAFKSIV
jgi:hypothetical protein